MKYAVLRTEVQNRGSSSTVRKFSRPTHSGAVTRFVCWKLITTARPMGYQAKYAKTASRGIRRMSVLSPRPVPTWSTAFMVPVLPIVWASPLGDPVEAAAGSPRVTGQISRTPPAS